MRRVLRIGVPLAISVACAVYAARGVDLDALGNQLSGTQPGWILLAVALLGVSVWIRALRWRAVFPPADRLLLTPSVAWWTVAVGLFFNAVLPARLGEVARMVAVYRTTGIARTQSLTATVVERMYDVASLALLLLCIAPVVPRSDVVGRLAVASVVVMVATAAVALAILRSQRLRALALRLLERAPRVGGLRAGGTQLAVRAGLVGLRDRGAAAKVAGWSVVSWIGLAATNYCCLRALAIEVPWHAAVLALVATNFAMVVPSTSGGLGVFEAAAVSALSAYGVDPTTALSYAVVLHAVNLLPYLPLGLAAMARLGLRRSDIAQPETGRAEPA